MTERCEYYTEYETCNIISLLTDTEYSPSQEDCKACSLCKKPRSINHVTTLIADGVLTSIGLPKLHKVGTGPGTKLASILSWFVAKDPTCNCEERAATMDAWGVEGCRRNQRTILSWLRDSAQQQGLPFSSTLMNHTLNLIYLSFPDPPQEKHEERIIVDKTTLSEK